MLLVIYLDIFAFRENSKLAGNTSRPRLRCRQTKQEVEWMVHISLKLPSKSNTYSNSICNIVIVYHS